MSTRGTYFFKDEHNTIAVYRHHDNYPSGALDAIKEARLNAWEGDRFEADEAGAAFVAANKSGPGGVRLMSGNAFEHVSGDCEYIYTITNGWKVEAREVLSGFWDKPGKSNTRIIFTGQIDAFEAWVAKEKATA